MEPSQTPQTTEKAKHWLEELQAKITGQHFSAEEIAGAQQKFFEAVYRYMFGGLFLSALVAYVTISSRTILFLVLGNRLVFYGLLLAELGLVIWMTARIAHMSAKRMTTLFFVYAALNGLTISVVLLIFTFESVVSTFFVTALMFGAMSVYGYLTKKDLSSWGSTLLMLLVGLILASLANIFLRNDSLGWIITYAGITIFVGLTAYDTQKLKSMSVVGLADKEHHKKWALAGALTLYLDFINLFLLLLRVFGKRK